MASVKEGAASLGGDASDSQWAARATVEGLALALQGSLLVRGAPAAVADAFCGARLGDGGRAFGTLPAGVHAETIIDRALGSASALTYWLPGDHSETGSAAA